MRARLSVLAAALAASACASGPPGPETVIAEAPLCAPGVQLGKVVVAPLTRWRQDQKEPAVREAIAQRALEAVLPAMPCASSVKVLAVAADAQAESALPRQRLRARNRVAHPDRRTWPVMVVSFPALWSTWSDVKFTLDAIDVETGALLRSIAHHRQKGGAFEARGLEPLQGEMEQALRDVIWRRALAARPRKQRARGRQTHEPLSCPPERARRYFDIASWKLEATFSMKPSVVSQGWSGPMRSERSLVMKPASTVSMTVFSSVVGELGEFGVVVELGAVGEATRPGEDRGDRVGRGRLALLVGAVVARDGAVGGFGFDRLAVRRHQHRGHQAERAIALRDRVGLDVAVIVLARPDIAAGPFEAGRNHVVDQAVFVGAVELGELVLELGVEHFLEDVLEAAVIGLEDRVLGREIDRPFALAAEVERGAREIADRLVEVVHAHGDAGAGEVEHFVFDRRRRRRPACRLIVSLPGPGTLKSVALYWSPKA